MGIMIKWYYLCNNPPRSSTCSMKHMGWELASVGRRSLWGSSLRGLIFREGFSNPKTDLYGEGFARLSLVWGISPCHGCAHIKQSKSLRFYLFFTHSLGSSSVPHKTQLHFSVQKAASLSLIFFSNLFYMTLVSSCSFRHLEFDWVDHILFFAFWWPVTLTFLIHSFIASFRVICYTWVFAHIEAGLQILILLHVDGLPCIQS